jgi:WD40 repeat protein
MRAAVLFLATLMVAFAATTVKPFQAIDVAGNVIDMVVHGDDLYVATDAGKMEVYDWKTRKQTRVIHFPKIKDFMGDLMDPKIFGVDVNKAGDRLLIQVQDEGGERILYLYEGDKRTRLLDKNDHIQMREVRFVDDGHILVATMSNELIYMSIPDKKILWQNKLSLSAFSDYQLSEDHTKVASTCESGIVYVVDVASGKILKVLDNGNKDNVFKVDYKNHHVLACGQDRKAVLYFLGRKRPIIYETTFLVYAGAFQIDENNDIGIYNNRTRSMRYKLVGQRSVLNNIVFIDDHTLISSSDDNHIIIWRIP